jgi:hypothetical protein
MFKDEYSHGSSRRVSDTERRTERTFSAVRVHHWTSRVDHFPEEGTLQMLF